MLPGAKFLNFWSDSFSPRLTFQRSLELRDRAEYSTLRGHHLLDMISPNANTVEHSGCRNGAHKKVYSVHLHAVLSQTTYYICRSVVGATNTCCIHCINYAHLCVYTALVHLTT